jgi:hypothetical protein
MKTEYVKFRHPFTCMVAGPTSSGKTVLVRRIIKNHQILFEPTVPKLKVLWAYGQWQDLYNQPIGENVECRYVEGLPSEEEIIVDKPQLIIIDDLMTEIGKSEAITRLFTIGSHHNNISVMFLTQNMYHPKTRTISLNCHVMIILNSPRDLRQIITLGSQIFPGATKYFIDAYKKATSVPYGYIKIDLSQKVPHQYRLQSRITPEEVEHLNLAPGEIAPIFYIQ